MGFLTWLLFVATFLIGYFIGQGKLTTEEVQRAYKRLTQRSKVGAISNPTQRQMEKKNPLVEGELEEMRKAFSNIKLNGE